MDALINFLVGLGLMGIGLALVMVPLYVTVRVVKSAWKGD